MIGFQIYASSAKGRLLADYTARAGDGGGLSFSTNRHGFQALSAPLIPMALIEAFALYDYPGTPHAVVTDYSGGVIWEGRVEDITIVPGGVALVALGYQRALHDLPYTALWSKTSTADWDEVDESVRGAPGQYEMDNNNRLYIAPRKGEAFSSSAQSGELTYAVPHNGERAIAHFSASYALTLPANWEIRLLSCDDDYANIVVEATVTATGSPQSGSWAITTSAKRRLIFAVRNNSGGSTTITTETGAMYAKLTSIRIKSTTSATVTASAIAAALASYLNGINPAQLSGSAALIEVTGTDLGDEVYEDEWPATILDRLALLHGYEWSVWEGRLLNFRPRAGGGRHWYVDVVGGLELQRSLTNIRNSAYASYRDASGRTLRTNTVGDAASQARYGLIRRGFINVQTTSLGEAQTHRSAWLADTATDQARASILFDHLYDAAGAAHPLYLLRAGDTLTMRNLPPTLSTEIDRIRTFTVGETEYDAVEGTLTVAPDEATPTLDRLVARQETGDSSWPRRGR